jgi:hypothetical protein
MCVASLRCHLWDGNTHSSLVTVFGNSMTRHHTTAAVQGHWCPGPVPPVTWKCAFDPHVPRLLPLCPTPGNCLAVLFLCLPEGSAFRTQKGLPEGVLRP